MFPTELMQRCKKTLHNFRFWLVLQMNLKRTVFASHYSVMKLNCEVIKISGVGRFTVDI